MANAPIPNGSSASRNLFPNDPNGETEENRANVFSMRSHVAESRERWNFDFENETPLEGDWEWEKTEDGGGGGGENVDSLGDTEMTSDRGSENDERGERQ